MAKLNQPLRDRKPNLGEFIGRDNGSYKEVSIYEYGVLKAADPDAGEYKRGYYNSDDSWRSDSNCSYYDGDEVLNTYEEIAREFNYVVSRPASPVLAPILWGDEEEFIMAKVKVADKLERKIKINRSLLKHKQKKVFTEVLRLCSLANIKISLSALSNFAVIAQFGIEQGLSEKSIAKSIYHFLRLDAFGGIMSDMHDSNFGLYRNRIVALDLGLAGNNNNGSLKEYINSKNKSKLVQVKDFLERRNKIQNPLFVSILSYKRDSKKLNIEYRGQKYLNIYVEDIRIMYGGSFRVMFNNGLSIYDTEFARVAVF